MGLEMRLESDLNPKITGFAGDYRSGDLYNLVGPFKEHNRTIRQLLDQIVAESKGGAWILPAEDTRAWEILEYRDPNMNYTVFLRVIAAH
jgi:hypothetical protein